MTNENHESILLNLSRSWREKVKNIRKRAKIQKNLPDDNTENSTLNAEGLALDSDLFANSENEQISAKHVFSGDENFINSLEMDNHFSKKPVIQKYKSFSILQKILAAGIITVSGMLVFIFLKSYSSQAPASASASNKQAQSIAEQKPKPENIIAHENLKLETINETGEPLSLQVAQDFYFQGNYNKAYTTYKQLCQKLSESDQEIPMRDFLRLKMALCLEKLSDYDQVGRLLNLVSKSTSPAVNVIANYHLGLLEKQRKHYLAARTKAYQTLAIVNAVDFDRDFAWALQRECFFLAAQSLSAEVLSLCDVNQTVPSELWISSDIKQDPFVGLDELKLRSFLNSGMDRLKALR